MLNLLKIEFCKLKSSKTFYIMIILCLLQGAAMYVFSETLEHSNGKESLLYMFRIQNYIGLSILLGTFASEFIVTEFTSGYIKNLISYGHKRINIFIAKSIVYYVGIIMMTIVAPLVITIINTVINGYGEQFTLSSFVNITGECLLTMFIEIAIGSISVLAAFVIRNISITIAFVIGLDFVNRILDLAAMKNKVLTAIYDKIIYSQLGFVIDDKVSASQIIQAINVSLITIALTTALGIYIFKKSDIK